METYLLVRGKYKFYFLELCGNFPPNIFSPQLVESLDVEPTDTESRLYLKWTTNSNVGKVLVYYIQYFFTNVFSYYPCVRELFLLKIGIINI